jgi:hypothetical protein
MSSVFFDFGPFGGCFSAGWGYFFALMFFAAAGVLYFTGSMMIDYGRKLPI